MDWCIWCQQQVATYGHPRAVKTHLHQLHWEWPQSPFLTLKGDKRCPTLQCTASNLYVSYFEVKSTWFVCNKQPQKVSSLGHLHLWHYRLWSFKTRDTKLERFLKKNRHTQRKLLNFENWTNGEPQQLAKIRV